MIIFKDLEISRNGLYHARFKRPTGDFSAKPVEFLNALSAHKNTKMEFITEDSEGFISYGDEIFYGVPARYDTLFVLVFQGYAFAMVQPVRKD